jgi:hypothetical protein
MSYNTRWNVTISWPCHVSHRSVQLGSADHDIDPSNTTDSFRLVRNEYVETQWFTFTGHSMRSWRWTRHVDDDRSISVYNEQFIQSIADSSQENTTGQMIVKCRKFENKRKQSTDKVIERSVDRRDKFFSYDVLPWICLCTIDSTRFLCATEKQTLRSTNSDKRHLCLGWGK